MNSLQLNLLVNTGTPLDLELPTGLEVDKNGNIYLLTTSKLNSDNSGAWSNRRLFRVGISDGDTWIKQGNWIGGSAALAITTEGAIYIGGSFNGRADIFGNGSKISIGGEDLFIANVYENFLLGINQNPIASQGKDVINDIKISPTGKIFITGRWNNNQAFVAKIKDQKSPTEFYSDFAIEWGGTINGQEAHEIGFDTSGNLYVTSDNGAASPSYLTKINGNGNVLWTKNLGNVTTSPGGLAVDKYGNVIVAGTSGVSKTYLSKFDSLGNAIWTDSWDILKIDDLVVDESGDIYITGDFSGTPDFNPGLESYKLTSQGYTDMYIAKLDYNGNFIWAESFGSSGFDESYNIALDSNNAIYIAGNFGHTVDFSPGSSTSYLTSRGFSDTFIAEYQQIDLPDLVISAISMPNSINVNETLTITYKIDNIGQKVAVANRTLFVLSKDEIVGNNDDLSLSYEVTNINGNSTRIESVPVAINSNIPLGTYHLYVKADSRNSVAEKNESNNWGIAANTITINSVNLDFGDLPSPKYAAVLDGRHTITQNLKLGTAITDAETAAQSNATATGDDIAGATPDDEDGVTLPAQIVAGQNTTFNVNVTNSIGSAATLYGFVDWNKDGDFLDTGETATAPVNNNFTGNVPLVFSVPTGAVTEMDLGARFRISTQSGLGAGGQAPNGEVEDYIVQSQAATTDIKIINTAGNAPDGSTLTVNSSGPVTFNYKVSTGAGNVSLSNVAVVDDNGTPGNTSDDFNPAPVLSGGFNTGDTNQNNLLDPGEMWQYQAIVPVKFDTEIYAYAYQQITNLLISGLPTPLVQSNTSAGSALLTSNPTPPGQINNQFNVNESFISSSQTSGVNLGEGNNTGFFSGNPIPNSDKGKVNADYSRGDAVLSSSNAAPVAITSAGQLQNLLGSTGVNGAGVAESYLDKPVNTLFQTSPKNYYKDEGNGNGEWLITSNPFTVANNTTIQFNYNYLNKLSLEVDPTTPPGANESSLARAQVEFQIQINYKLSSDGSSDVLFLHQPAQTNKNISLSTTPGQTQTVLATGSQQDSTQLFRDIDGDNVQDSYTIVIRGGNLANTRLVLEDKLLRTNIATVTGTPVGIGGTVQDTDNATVAVNTIPPVPGAPLGAAPLGNISSEAIQGPMLGTEALFPQGSSLI